ncbi:MAG TPA: sugar ABC transporter ATP-binding protein [Opitutaceae bacterium]|nr:sugar ABC transporter ATP-binding protein [Opitutaceae bacterium]
MPENLLELRGISKRFSGVVALDSVDLTLQRGRVLALLGENGAGKSTLMKILSGAHRPDGGTIRLDGREVHLRSPDEAQALGINIIHQEFSLVPHLDVVENIFLGRERTGRFGLRAKRIMRQEAQAMLDRLGARIRLDSPVAQLSVAEQQFVEIAKALLRQTRILIMDEPTATLTTDETARLFRLMRDLKASGVAIVFISHHFEEIFAIADDVVCLRDGRVVGEGLVASYSARDLIRLMVGREVNHTYPPKAVGPRRSDGLEIRSLQRKPHLPEVTFTVRAGEVLGIAGLVGSGRTKMVRALIGADRAHRHEVYLRGTRLKISSPADARRAGIGLVPEDRKRQGLILDASAPENILITNLRKVCNPLWRFIDRAAADRISREHLRNLAVKTSSLRQAVRTLSGGNQQKVVIAKWLNADCEILILDEPTRGIDVGAKAEIYRLIRELTARGFAIIMISSELPEVLGLSDCVMVMRRQRVERFFDRGEEVTAENIMAYATGGNHV